MTESPVIPAPPSPAAEPLRPSLLRHAAALVYDSLLVLPLVMVSVGSVLALSTLTTAGSDPEPLHPQLVQGLAVLTVAGFYCAFWQRGGQTLGMQAWRIHLVAQNGGRPTIRACLIRLCGACLSTGLLGAGFWSAALDPQRRYWHDRWSGTRLEYRPQANRGSARPLQQ